MSLLRRIGNVFRRDRVQREIDEELASHFEDAMESGRSRAEVRRAFGSALRHREASSDVKLASWLDSLRSDAIFGFRQLKRRPVVTAAAILSLALAAGSTTAAFRLVDAILLRPLPVADPASLYTLAHTYIDRDGRLEEDDSFSYPQLLDFREAAGGKATLMVVSYAVPTDIHIAETPEKANRQYVSGIYFSLLGLSPSLGRLFTEADDQKPGAHPVAVISHDYWTRRFANNPGVIGSRFRHGGSSYEIIGIGPAGYLGTEPGIATDFYLPAMENAKAINSRGWRWARIWARARPGVAAMDLLQPIQIRAYNDRIAGLAKSNASEKRKQDVLKSEVRIYSASAGTSGLQKSYRQPLIVLSGIVLLVLLIACANVANLLAAQAGSREREMALRVSIGAGRGRLLQLMLVECSLLALAAIAFGTLFALWSTPLVVSMINPADSPVRLNLEFGWRSWAFSAALAVAVTLLFGLSPALRASAVKPVSALKGGEYPHQRRRLMNALVAAQVMFCFLVHFVAGLFVVSFNRLSTQPTGFQSEGLFLMEALGGADAPKRPLSVWNEVAESLRAVPGVTQVGIASWGLMTGNAWSEDVQVPGQQPSVSMPYFLAVDREWFAAMGIPMLAGRTVIPSDRAPKLGPGKQPISGSVIVNESFARRYFNGESPIGKAIVKPSGGTTVPAVIVGYVKDVRYRNMREPIRPQVYVPFEDNDWATFHVRTPRASASDLRQAVKLSHPEFLVTGINPQQAYVTNQTLTERLLAAISLFFSVVAVVLAAVGLYGVLNYAVLQRRKEIGIRIALGARAAHIAKEVSAGVTGMLAVGAAAGLFAGFASERIVSPLLYQVKASDLPIMGTPLLILSVAGLLAILPPVIHAWRTDPATALRAE